MICRAGGLTKADIGTIRVFDHETKFEISAEAAGKFTADIKKRVGETRASSRSAPRARAAAAEGRRQAGQAHPAGAQGAARRVREPPPRLCRRGRPKAGWAWAGRADLDAIIRTAPPIAASRPALVVLRRRQPWHDHGRDAFRDGDLLPHPDSGASRRLPRRSGKGSAGDGFIPTAEERCPRPQPLYAADAAVLRSTCQPRREPRRRGRDVNSERAKPAAARFQSREARRGGSWNSFSRPSACRVRSARSRCSATCRSTYARARFTRSSARTAPANRP